MAAVSPGPRRLPAALTLLFRTLVMAGGLVAGAAVIWLVSTISQGAVAVAPPVQSASVRTVANVTELVPAKSGGSPGHSGGSGGSSGHGGGSGGSGHGGSAKAGHGGGSGGSAKAGHEGSSGGGSKRAASGSGKSTSKGSGGATSAHAAHRTAAEGHTASAGPRATGAHTRGVASGTRTASERSGRTSAGVAQAVRGAVRDTTGRAVRDANRAVRDTDRAVLAADRTGRDVARDAVDRALRQATDNARGRLAGSVDSAGSRALSERRSSDSRPAGVDAIGRRASSGALALTGDILGGVDGIIKEAVHAGLADHPGRKDDGAALADRILREVAGTLDPTPEPPAATAPAPTAPPKSTKPAPTKPAPKKPAPKKIKPKRKAVPAHAHPRPQPVHRHGAPTSTGHPSTSLPASTYANKPHDPEEAAGRAADAAAARKNAAQRRKPLSGPPGNVPERPGFDPYKGLPVTK